MRLASSSGGYARSRASPVAYRVEIAPAAGRDLRSLPRQAQVRIEPVILALAEVPRPHSVRKIQGEQSAYRIRLGPYRVIYEVHDRDRLVVVLRVTRRSESTYRDV